MPSKNFVYVWNSIRAWNYLFQEILPQEIRQKKRTKSTGATALMPLIQLKNLNLFFYGRSLVSDSVFAFLLICRFLSDDHGQQNGCCSENRARFLFSVRQFLFVVHEQSGLMFLPCKSKLPLEDVAVDNRYLVTVQSKKPPPGSWTGEPREGQAEPEVTKSKECRGLDDWSWFLSFLKQIKIYPGYKLPSGCDSIILKMFTLN